LSVNNDRVTSQALNKSCGKERRKRCVFRRLWKTSRDDADVTWRGRSFQVRLQEKHGRRQSTVVYGVPALMWSAPIVGRFCDCCALGLRVSLLFDINKSLTTIYKAQ